MDRDSTLPLSLLCVCEVRFLHGTRDRSSAPHQHACSPVARFDQVGARASSSRARPKNGLKKDAMADADAAMGGAAGCPAPRAHDRANFSSWMAGRLLDAVDETRKPVPRTRPTSTTASGAHKYVYVDSTLFVDSELDDKGQSVAVGRPRRALLFARPLLLTYPASIVGSLAMARTSRMYVGASAALCRRKLGG